MDRYINSELSIYFTVLIINALWISMLYSHIFLVDKCASYPQEIFSTVYDPAYMYSYTEVIKITYHMAINR